MKRRFVVAVALGMALLTGLLLARAGGLELAGWPQRSAEKASPDDPYRPLALPGDVRAQLVVWDHPWPHANPLQSPDRFQGERPVLWRQRLEQAVAAFRRAYPGVTVTIEERGFDEDWRSHPEPPDIVAVWWDGPQPVPDQVVPVERYLDDATRAEYHPLAWRLLEHNGQFLGWPRWVAFHYWFAPTNLASGEAQAAPTDWSAVAESGWTWREAEAAAASGLLVPPAGPGLWLELLADPAPPAGDGAEAMAAPTAREALSAALAALTPRLPGYETLMDQLAARFLERCFGVAAGFGPALGYWAVSPPLSDRAAPPPSDLVLLPPATLTAPASRVPVLSVGAYAVLRRPGANEATRAQLAMELARHLSRWQPEAAVARLLAFPAHRSALERWRQGTTLTPALVERLLADAAYAASLGARRYGAWPGDDQGSLDPLQVEEPYRRWLAGELSAEEAARALWGEAGAEGGPGEPGRN
ncbi:MAG TPA: hypothetical protein VIL95_04135 [Bacillota bacterium]